METKNHVIASKSKHDGKEIFWQFGPWWGCLRDAQGFTEEEARRHEAGFNNAGVHQVYVVDRSTRV